MLILSVGSALTNLLFVVLAVLLVRGGRAQGWCSGPRPAATLLNLHWVITMESDRRYLETGYFIWVCSFALLAFAAFLAASRAVRSNPTLGRHGYVSPARACR